MSIAVRSQGAAALLLLGLFGLTFLSLFLVSCWFFFSEPAEQAQLYIEDAGLTGMVINFLIFWSMFSGIFSPLILWTMRRQFHYAWTRLITGIDVRAVQNNQDESPLSDNLTKWLGK
ncbi:MAG: hypothetical protein P8O79_02075 [Halieaceae bacterium]|nr:hypothetical protein [Halieaceae bacterium]